MTNRLQLRTATRWKKLSEGGERGHDKGPFRSQQALQ